MTLRQVSPLGRIHNVRHRLRTAAAREALRRAGPILNESVLALEYPPNQRNEPRYLKPHAVLDEQISRGRGRYAATLAMMKRYSDDLGTIDVRERDAMAPAWINGFLPGLDGAAIYSFLRTWAPQRYYEVGSGNSTRFAARAKRDGKLGVKITSIDPHPRADIDQLCDEVIREPLESQDLAPYKLLQPGDVVFMDGSHRVFMNGDVVTFFLDILPNLPAGVLVGIHDIYLPYDYPVAIADRYYSEQYVLAAWLLGGTPAEIVLPAHWAYVRMRDEVESLWATNPRFAAIEHHGAGFWLTTGASR